jgi:phenylalanyl-tRNA synthetase alpha subunit
MKSSEDYLVASLLDFFRKPENETNYYQAAKIALNQVERMAHISSCNLEKRFLFFASRLKNNVCPATLRLFAQSCLLSAEKIKLIKNQAVSETTNLKSSANLRKKALKDIAQALSKGHSENAAVVRAANNLKSEQVTFKLSEQKAKKIQHHPLRDTLEVLNSHHKKLAQEDIRNKLLNLKNYTSKNNSSEGVLFTILKKAQAFSNTNLHSLLGDNLFHLCRPLGFLDKNDTTVVIEVPSSAHLHALTYKKLEILRALKRDPNFGRARFIKFQVKNSF